MELGRISTIILCGGRGTRAYPHTVEVPKPLLEVAGRPVLQHVIEIYARQGFRNFVLAAGYRIDMIQDFAAAAADGLNVQVLDTGEDANTGTRVLRCREAVGDRFFLTYADGVGNVDLGALLAFHASGGSPATMTTVPLPSQYGTVVTDESATVLEFKEKPILRDHWINGGFFVMDQAVFDGWAGADLEKEVLPRLAGSGRLRAYQHHGFWKSLDTYKDALDLTALAGSGDPPWFHGAHEDAARAG